MKYYLITGFILAVFALLWFTRDVKAEVIDAPTEAQNTITGVTNNENGCTTFTYGHEVSKNLQTLKIVRCAKIWK